VDVSACKQADPRASVLELLPAAPVSSLVGLVPEFSCTAAAAAAAAASVVLRSFSMV